MNEFNCKRAAIYIRVSTDEQALHGYSLEAQKETLTQFAKSNDMKIVDYYADEGVSARKKYTTRKEFMRMLEDVKQNKIDVILFIKLDRWFRSVSDYYKVQDILEKHKVTWKAVLEDYDTATANGRLHINIKLSIAQDESDRTSERIKFVFENKIKNKEVVTGSIPLGYKIENKRLVIDPEKANIIKAIFTHFNSTHSIRGTMIHIENTFGLHLCYVTVKNILKNKLYIGKYKNIENYCPAIIDETLFNNIKNNLKRNVKTKIQPKYNYIFSSMVYCGLCEHAMSGYSSGTKKKYRYYRCRYHLERRLCPGVIVSETFIENYLINNIGVLLKESIELETNSYKNYTPKKKIDKSSIKRKLSKLKELYLNDLISLEEYKRDHEKYNNLLNATDEPKKKTNENLSDYLDFIHGKDWVVMYNSFSNEDKRIFWRGFIDRILVDDKKNITVKFL